MSDFHPLVWRFVNHVTCTVSCYEPRGRSKPGRLGFDLPLHAVYHILVLSWDYECSILNAWVAPKLTIRLSKMPCAATHVAFHDKTWRLRKDHPCELSIFHWRLLLIACRWCPVRNMASCLSCSGHTTLRVCVRNPENPRCNASLRSTRLADSARREIISRAMWTLRDAFCLIMWERPRVSLSTPSFTSQPPALWTALPSPFVNPFLKPWLTDASSQFLQTLTLQGSESAHVLYCFIIDYLLTNLLDPYQLLHYHTPYCSDTGEWVYGRTFGWDIQEFRYQWSGSRHHRRNPDHGEAVGPLSCYFRDADHILP